MAGRPPKRRKYSSRFSSFHQPHRNNIIYSALSDNTLQVPVHSVGSMVYECAQCHALHFLGEKIQSHYKNCCHNGKVFLDEQRSLKPMPDMLLDLYKGQTSDSNHFKVNIRQYNAAFAMASIKSNLPTLPPGVFTYRVQGQVYTKIGSLRPIDGDKPQYSQLYIIEDEAAIEERLSDSRNSACRNNIMRSLQTMLNDLNPFVRVYKKAATILAEEELQAATENRPKHLITMQFYKDQSLDLRRYNSPNSNEVAIIFVGEDGEPPINIDFSVQEYSQHLTALKSTSPNIDPLAFPLLFPSGELGWHEHLQHRAEKQTARNRLTMLQFYQYRLAIRNTFSPLFYAEKLFHEYCVLAYVRIESQRLHFLRTNQKQLRAEKYNNLMDTLYNEDSESGQNIGKMIILPSSYIGSPRHMMQNYQDSMAIVCKYGKPDLFITFTCNPSWQEIIENLQDGTKKEHRPDLIARVFKLKLDELLDDITKKHIFGIPSAWFYTIEFQKRGLPHAHILIILRNEDKPRSAEDYDKFVSAEIPEPDKDPDLFQTVSKNMIHGPCGPGYFNSPCMKNDGTGPKCSKNFPKSFCEETKDGTQQGGYAIIKRRDNGRTVKKKDFECDNRWVVPYNPYLCKKYNAHINVEICSTVKSVKYINKYIYKGHDRAKIQITVTSHGSSDQPASTNVRDEIKDYVDTRYVSAPEAVWRIFEFSMHKMSHTIVQLGIHLENQQTVIFTDNDVSEAAVRSTEKSTLLSFFELNRINESARQYLYTEIPTHFRFVNGQWQPRISQSAAEKVIARMYNYSFSDRERYYLRLLLLHVRGPTCFSDVRTYENVVYDTYRAAAQARGLLLNDDEWERCLNEAINFQLPRQLRQLFALICVFCGPSDPNALWEKFKAELSDDFIRSHPEIIAKQLALQEIDKTLSHHGKKLKDFDLPEIDVCENVVFSAEQDCIYDCEKEKENGHTKYQKCNAEQAYIVDTIINAVKSFAGRKLFYLDGPGGTGKTFVFMTILHILRSENKICLPIAFSGIAATLLAGGRTAHSRFKIPINSDVDSTSHMSIGSPAAKLLKDTHLIIWDEAPMTKNHDIVVVDRLLQDIMKSKVPFGGKTVLFAGDFRQLLPVVVNGSKNDIINASIKRLSLWPNFTQLRLAHNMRAHGDLDFAKWVLKVGDGTANENGDDSIELPPQCIIENSIVDHVFGASLDIQNYKCYSMKTILTPKNEDCFLLNDQVVDKIPGVLKIYESSDAVVVDDHNHTDVLNYPVEYLNSITPAGLPPHTLKLKVGCIVMLLRNLNPTLGLCNGTRLIIRALGSRVIDAEIISGDHAGDRVFIPRIRLQPSNSQLPFNFSRLQFPIRLSFAMTINKSQGQTFDKIGIFLPNPVFTHGQFYVAISRVRRFEDIKIQIINSDKQGLIAGRYFTKNVVYREIL